MSADDARRRFDEATQLHLLAPLPDGVEVRPCTDDEWDRHTGAWWSAEARPILDPGALVSEDQRARVADLEACLTPPLRHRVLLWREGAAIGGYWGRQERWGRYHMINTILRTEVRGRGVYRALLANVERAVADAGFLEMSSRHRADNNAVIVPKLKAGWVITAFEVDLELGLLVHLRKYLHDHLARLNGYRVDGGDADALRAAGLKVP